MNQGLLTNMAVGAAEWPADQGSSETDNDYKERRRSVGAAAGSPVRSEKARQGWWGEAREDGWIFKSAGVNGPEWHTKNGA